MDCVRVSTPTTSKIQLQQKDTWLASFRLLLQILELVIINYKNVFICIYTLHTYTHIKINKNASKARNEVKLCTI